jgi:hypothetical protein
MITLLTKLALNTDALETPKSVQQPQTKPKSELSEYLSVGHDPINLRNPDCKVTAWVYRNGVVEAKEVGNTGGHSSLFTNVNWGEVYAGRYDACTQQLSIAPPVAQQMPRVPSLLIRQLRRTFGNDCRFYVMDRTRGSALVFLNASAEGDSKTADSLYTDYQDTSNLYEPAIPMITRGPDDYDLLKTWKRKKLPHGKRIYQLGVDVPTTESVDDQQAL